MSNFYICQYCMCPAGTEEMLNEHVKQCQEMTKREVAPPKHIHQHTIPVEWEGSMPVALNTAQGLSAAPDNFSYYGQVTKLRCSGCPDEVSR